MEDIRQLLAIIKQQKAELDVLRPLKLAADALEELEDRLVSRRIDNEYDLRVALQKLDAYARQNYEIEQILCKALGLRTGTETLKTLAIKAAKKISK